MQPTDTMRPDQQGLVVHAVRLTRLAFAPFGDVVENPRPGVHPSSVNKSSPPLPFSAVSANQGSAIKYQHVSRQLNLYDQAPSGRTASAVMSIFTCAARARIPDPHPASASAPAPTPAQEPTPTGDPDAEPPSSTFPVSVLERHPFTTQTFIPLTADPNARYLVIVAPTLPPGASSSEQQSVPVPAALPPSSSYPRPLPGSGMPDLRRLRAFVATATQAVTYGAGTWHAPMVALGDKVTNAMDFVVVQFANGVAVEDCQEVYLESGPKSGSRSDVGHGVRVLIKLLPLETRTAKL